MTGCLLSIGSLGIDTSLGAQSSWSICKAVQSSLPHWIQKSLSVQGRLEHIGDRGRVRESQRRDDGPRGLALFLLLYLDRLYALDRVVIF